MKFNLLSKVKNQTVNHAGAKAFTLSPEMELYTAAVTWSLNDSFYEKDEARFPVGKVQIRVLPASNCSYILNHD